VEILMLRRLPQIIATVFGVALFLLYFSSHPSARALNQVLVDSYWQIIFGCAVIVGVFSFLKVNLKAISNGNQVAYRWLSIAAVIAMPALAVIWGRGGDSPFMWVFDNIQIPLQSTVFALLAFFVASASYRGFRARSIAATVLLFAALLVLISRSALGEYMWEQFPVLTDWIRNTPSMAARRAILIGIGLGSLTTSLRVILGIERTWLGGNR
jgi:hypothetical protein